MTKLGNKGNLDGSWEEYEFAVDRDNHRPPSKSKNS
jgi:hypothetical protein